MSDKNSERLCTDDIIFSSLTVTFDTYKFMNNFYRNDFLIILCTYRNLRSYRAYCLNKQRIVMYTEELFCTWNCRHMNKLLENVIDLVSTDLFLQRLGLLTVALFSQRDLSAKCEVPRQ